MPLVHKERSDRIFKYFGSMKVLVQHTFLYSYLLIMSDSLSIILTL